MSLPVAAPFQAIVAGPLSGSPVASDSRSNGYETYGGVRFQDASGTKRKKDHDDAAPSIPKKVVRRTSEDEGGSAREQTISYKDRESLLRALQDRFKQGPHVDFHGTYELRDSCSPHKARIKSMATEIWKATGYRFTVKDHPQFSNGHKTRFWCSQDDAHRSKSSRAARKAQGDLYKPRQSSSGETLAKTRFPCRSRLLISSRDSDIPGLLVVTVRMHHHLAHEPYVDLNLPPGVAQNVYDNYWTMKLPAGAHTTTNGTDEMTNPPQPGFTVQQSNEQLSEEDSPQEQETFNNFHPELQNDIPPEGHSRATIFTQDHDPPPPPPPSSYSSTPQIPTNPLQNDIYSQRMRAHIRNIRDFCEGLEFQLQFNDHRLLEVFEREGARFLDFVGDCLKKEGRLVVPDAVPPSHSAAQPQSNGVTHAEQPALSSLQIQRPFEANPSVLGR